MRKFLVLCGLLCLLPLAGCSSDDEAKSYAIAEAGSWHDGKYSAQAEGYAGSFSVTITIANGHLQAIEVGDHAETPDRGGAALESMIPKMIDAQSYDVDAMSGATITADGLRDAVARCLEEASAK